MNIPVRIPRIRPVASLAAIVMACTAFASPSFASGKFIPKLTPGSETFPAGRNARGAEDGVILPGGRGFRFIGRASFAGTGVRVFGRSDSTQSSDGASNFLESAFGGSAIDNRAYRQTYLTCAGRSQLSRFYRLAVKELAANGMGSVQLEFRFDAPVRGLHLVVFDIDELSNGKRESLVVNAYDSTTPRAADKIDATAWKVLAQGDLSLYNGARPEQVTLPPSWYALNAGTPRTVGVLQARNRLRHETISNQNRDYTVLTTSEPVRHLRVEFRGSRAERRGARPEIGAHAYVGLWYPSSSC